MSDFLSTLVDEFPQVGGAEQVSRDRAADRGDEQEEDDEHAAPHRDPVAAEADPHLLPVAPRAYRLGAFAESGA